MNKCQANKSFHISTPKEFSFRECLQFLARSRLEKLHFVENDRVRKLFKSAGKNFLLELTSPSATSIQVEFLNTVPAQSHKTTIYAYIREWFDLDTDLAPFYKLAENDSLLKNLVRQFYGFRLLKMPDLFETACWSIIGQQINLTFAYTLQKRLIEAYGQRYEFNQRAYWLFPFPNVIAELSPSDLRQLQFTGKKAEYIIGLARLIQEGKISKASLLALPNIEAVRSELLKIRGIGPWTANYILMRCLGFSSAFPIEDIGLHNAIKRQLNLTRKPTIAEIRQLSAGWQNWQAYAAFYLYRSLI